MINLQNKTKFNHLLKIIILGMTMAHSKLGHPCTLKGGSTKMNEWTRSSEKSGATKTPTSIDEIGQWSS